MAFQPLNRTFAPIMENLRRYAFLLVCFLMSLSVGAAEVDTHRQFNTLLQQFEKTEKAQDANRLFELLNNLEFTDSLMRFDGNVPTDSLRQQVWYWAAEYLYDQQEYQRALDYGKKALPLLKGKEGESDCLNLMAVICIRIADYSSAASFGKALQGASLPVV